MSENYIKKLDEYSKVVKPVYNEFENIYKIIKKYCKHKKTIDVIFRHLEKAEIMAARDMITNYETSLK